MGGGDPMDGVMMGGEWGVPGSVLPFGFLEAWENESGRDGRREKVLTVIHTTIAFFFGKKIENETNSTSQPTHLR
jgi:hypothetical protein